jgi:hypothetical protein
VTRVRLQNFTKDAFRGLPVVCDQRCGCLLDVLSLRITQPRSLEGHTRVRVLFKVDERITVRHPCQMMMRHFLQYPAHLLARLRGPTGMLVGASQVHTRVRELRHSSKNAFESANALGDLVLRQEGRAQKPEAINLTRELCLEGAQLALGGSRTTGLQRSVRLTEAILEGGF